MAWLGLSTAIQSLGAFFPGRLEIGLQQPLYLRQESLSNQADACRVLYISDLHLRPGRSRRLCGQVLDAVATSGADAILLGGDLVDAASELEKLSELILRLTTFGPVLAVAGNHDRKAGLDRVENAVTRAGGQWIHGSSYEFTHGSRLIVVCGPDADEIPFGNVRILCAHYPTVWRASKDRGYDLILAGHLHGCQAVAFQFRGRLFPGAFFYPCCFLSQQTKRARLVVSRGVSDLIPIRWRCPREVVLCHV